MGKGWDLTGRLIRLISLLGIACFLAGCNTQEGSVSVDVGSAPLAAAYRVDVYAQEGGLGLVEGQYLVDESEVSFDGVPVGRWSVLIQAQNGDLTTIAHYIEQIEVKADETTYLKAGTYRPGVPGDPLPESENRIETFGPDGRALLTALYAPGVQSLPAASVSLLAENGAGLGESSTGDMVSAQRGLSREAFGCATAWLAGQAPPTSSRAALPQTTERPAYGSVAPGETISFSVATTFRTVDCARLLSDSQTQHCLIFSEVVGGTPILSEARALEIAHAFDADNPFQEGDTGLYADTRARFGSEWNTNPVGGRDGDNRVVLVFLSSDSIGGEGFFGFFSPLDQRSKDVAPTSNEGEILFLNADRANDDLYDALDTISHEFVHLILFNEKVGQDGQFPEGAVQENITLDEGLAVLNEDLSGFGFEGTEGGNGFLLGAVKATLEDGLNRPFFTFSRGYSDYGAGYLFWRYVLDQFGAESLRAITTSTATGKENVGAVLNQPFASVFSHFVQAVALNGEAGLSEELSFSSLSLFGTYVDRSGESYVFDGLRGIVDQSFPASVTTTVELQPWGAVFTRASGGDGGPLLWRATGIDSLVTAIVDLGTVAP